MADHKHRWQGFRGGSESFQMCVTCGKKRKEETLVEEAPTPEPVEINAEDRPPAPPQPEPVEE